MNEYQIDEARLRLQTETIHGVQLGLRSTVIQTAIQRRLAD